MGAPDDDARTVEAKTRPSAQGEAPELSLDPLVSLSSLEVGDIIGEGGMGIVRTAMQRSLARPVAIKVARPGATPDDAQRMLREAWVTGFLEHPGVVPVHDIVKGDAGAPVVVMRRIQGVTWEDCLADVALAKREGARDLLEHNLRVLLRVAEIVEFAHTRGVVHRDIKPANVMLGPFGEVYLLDWGLAVGLGGEATAHLPRPEESREMAGTLQYAAPEMVGMGGGLIDERTDIYLLGAVLYEIATGVPPHGAASTAKMLEAIASTPPRCPPTMPARLIATCSRAMQKDPARRHASVSELRHDVLDFLRSRDCERLVAEAEAIVAKLAEACQHGASRQRIYDLYGECRFAFREVLRVAPDDEAAVIGREVAATLVIEHELARDPRVALALVEEATAVSSELASRVRAAAGAEEKRLAGLSRLAHDQDQRVGRRARVVLFVGLGLAWSSSHVFADAIGPVTHVRFAIGGLLALLPISFAWIGWRALSHTAFNRRVLLSLALMVVAQSVLFFAGLRLGIDVFSLRVLQIGLWTTMAATASIHLDRRCWPMTCGLALALGVTLVWPEARAIASVLGIWGVTANLAVLGSRWGARTSQRG
ncbi:MAG: serine/threonine protein kinase [Labilithrix sp.]|nr:serine/threonine protein kinase [Labilithrix sp.]